MQGAELVIFPLKIKADGFLLLLKSAYGIMDQYYIKKRVYLRKGVNLKIFT